jgi:hypothetical protein
MTETYWPNDEDTEGIGTHTAKANLNLSLFNEMGPRADHDLRHGKTPRRATRKDRWQKDNRQGSQQHLLGTRPTIMHYNL